MKALFEDLPKFETIIDQIKPGCLIDTCFLMYELEHKNLNKLSSLNGAITSFNMHEILHISHKISDTIRHELRTFLKSKKLCMIDINVVPGEWDKEKEFVNSVDSNLLKDIPDPSDAVLIAIAIKYKIPVIYTRDKHHLFTVRLENYIQKYCIEIRNVF